MTAHIVIAPEIKAARMVSMGLILHIKQLQGQAGYVDGVRSRVSSSVHRSDTSIRSAKPARTGCGSS
jgi:hypothetical protein